MALDKATILEMLEGMDPHTRSRIVTSLTEGTSPEERERIIDRTATKKVSPYTSDNHADLMDLALGEDEDLANALATWLKKPANQDWLEMMLEEETIDPSTVVGGAQLERDRGYFDTMEENPTGLAGIAQGLVSLLKRAGVNLWDLDEAAGVAPPVGGLQTPAEMGQGAVGGLRGMLAGGPSPPEEIMPDDLAGKM